MSLKSQGWLMCAVIATALCPYFSHSEQKHDENNDRLVKKILEIRTRGEIGGYEISRDESLLIYHDIFRVAYNKTAHRLVAIDIRTGKRVPRRNLALAFGDYFSFAGTRYGGPYVWECSKRRLQTDVSTVEGIKAVTPLALAPDRKSIVYQGQFVSSDATIKRFLLWDITANKHRFLGKAPKPRVLPPNSNGFGTNIWATPLIMTFSDANGRFAYFFHQKPPSGFHQHTPEVTDCATGMALCAVRPDAMLYDFGGRKNLWSLQCKIISSSRGSYPLRYRISPNGQLLTMPDYHQSPVTIVRHNEPTQANGTIAIVITPSGKFFGRPVDPASSQFPVKELCRLSEFKGAKSYRWSSKLSPDGKKLAAVRRGIEPANRDGLNKQSLLIVWDISLAYREAVKLLKKKRQKDQELQRAASLAELTRDRILLGLAAMPKSSVSNLRRALGRQTNAGLARKLIKDLDSKNIMVRERASRQLQKIGIVPTWTADVAKRQGKPVLQVVRSRAQKKLREIEASMEARQTMYLRVVDFLEQINRPDSKELLRTIAKGGYGETAAEAAKSSLTILN